MLTQYIRLILESVDFPSFEDLSHSMAWDEVAEEYESYFGQTAEEANRSAEERLRKMYAELIANLNQQLVSGGIEIWRSMTLAPSVNPVEIPHLGLNWSTRRSGAKPYDASHIESGVEAVYQAVLVNIECIDWELTAWNHFHPGGEDEHEINLIQDCAIYIKSVEVDGRIIMVEKEMSS